MAASTKKLQAIREAELAHITPALRVFAVPIDSIFPDPENTVKHDEDSIQVIMKSLAEFGQDQPLVVQKSNNLVRKGNGRLESGKRLEWKYIAAIFVDDNDIQGVLRSIADNRTSEYRSWDRRLVADMLTKISETGTSIEPTGFSEDDVKKMMQKLNASKADDPVEEGDEDEEPIDFAQATDLRLENLCFNSETQSEYRKMVEALLPVHRAETATELVLTLLREAYRKLPQE